MKRLWKEVYAFVLTFGPALLAVLLDTMSRRQDGKEGGEGD